MADDQNEPPLVVSLRLVGYRRGNLRYRLAGTREENARVAQEIRRLRGESSKSPLDTKTPDR
jgi:hypothetical protein